MAVNFLDGINVAGTAIVSDTLTVTAIGGIDIDTAGHASLTLDRASTSYDNNIMFRTNGDTKFRIWQDGNADYLYIRDDDNATNMVTFKKGGNVGIGTTSPGAKFHVSGGAIRIDDSQQLQFGNGNVKINNDSSGRMYLKAPLAYYFEGNGGYKMVLDGNSGNLGIGTTSPSAKLEVNDSANDLQMRVGSLTAGISPYIRLQGKNTANTTNYYADIELDAENGKLIFNDPGTSSGSIGTNPMVIDSSGNVGIGTTSPTRKLDVDGDGRFGSDVEMEKSITANDYYSSPNGPFGGAQQGINAVVVIPTKVYQLTLTFASGLLVGYVCDGEECPDQPPPYNE